MSRAWVVCAVWSAGCVITSDTTTTDKDTLFDGTDFSGDADADADSDTDSNVDTDADADTEPTTDTVETGTPPACPDFDIGNSVPQVFLETTLGAGDDDAPSCAGGAGSEDVTVQFIASTSGQYVFDTAGSAYDTVLSVLSACAGAELACDAGPGDSSSVSVDLLANQVVIVVVDGFDGAKGDFVLNVARITPETSCADQLDDDGNGQIDCLDPDCSGTVDCAATCPDEATVGFPTAKSGSTLGRPNEDHASCDGSVNDLASDESLDFTAPLDGTYGFSLTTRGTTFDAVLSLLDGCGGAELACSDVFGTGGEAVALDLSAGETVIAVVDGFDGASGDYELAVFTPTPSEGVCGDGIDDNVDGRTDCDDPDCEGAFNCLEDCGNGVDDGDINLFADCLDPDCELDAQCAEVCGNGNDDDSDGLTDCFDPYCELDGACSENCTNRIDDDGDTRIDCLDGYCASRAACLTACPDEVTTTVPDFVAGNTRGLTDSSAPSCAFSLASDTTVTFTAPVDGRYVFDTSGTAFDSVLYVTDGCGGRELGCNDDLDDTTGDARVILDLVAGQEVIAVVDGVAGASGDYLLHIDEIPVTEILCTDGNDDDLDGDFDCGDADCVADFGCIPVCPDDDLVDAIAGSTLGYPNESVGSCDLLGVPTSDRSAAFTAPADGTYAFGLATTTTLFDSVLYVTEGCGGPELGCDDVVGVGEGGGETVVLDLLEDQTVTVVVDGAAGATGDYELAVYTPAATETDCNDGFDNDVDALTDCIDADCSLAFDCVERCTNDRDDDGDGDIDCFDLGCAADAACQATCPEDVIGPLPIQVQGETIGETANLSGSCGGNTAGADVTYALTATTAGVVTLDTNGSSFDTVLYALESCGGAELACDDDDGMGTASRLQLNLAAGQTVIIVVDGVGIGTGGDFVLNVQ